MNSYKLMPLSALKDLVIELQLNKYAFFSSGYPDSTTPQTDFTQIVPYKRDTWKVTRCELVCEIIQMDKQIDQLI